jgi:hypothetical protein
MMSDWEDFFCIFPRFLQGGGFACCKLIQRRRYASKCCSFSEAPAFDCWKYMYRLKP